MSDDQILDPTFHLPPGVKDVKYQDYDEIEVFVEPDELDGSDDDMVEFSGADTELLETDELDDEGGIYPPDTMTIVSQQVRTLPGGGQVVDVTVELPDLEEGNKYDMRFTK